MATKIIMGRPPKYATEEERRAALRAAWRKYHAANKTKRAALNRKYYQRPDVKARLAELRKIKKESNLASQPA